MKEAAEDGGLVSVLSSIVSPQIQAHLKPQSMTVWKHHFEAVSKYDSLLIYMRSL